MFAKKLEKMKKVLIPTDYSVESLQLIEYAVLNNPDTKLDIVLVAGYKLPDTRWAISHFNKSVEINKQLDNDFITAKRSLILEHTKNIETICFELFTGSNVFAFQNFLEQFNAEDALVPKDNILCCHSHKWFDTTNFLKKNVKNVIEVNLEMSIEVKQQKFSIMNLFNL